MDSTGANLSSNPTNDWVTIAFNATLSNSLYGSSSTVQPASTQILMIIKS